MSADSIFVSKNKKPREAIKCAECGWVYNNNDSDEKFEHSIYHKNIIEKREMLGIYTDMEMCNSILDKSVEDLKYNQDKLSKDEIEHTIYNLLLSKYSKHCICSYQINNYKVIPFERYCNEWVDVNKDIVGENNIKMAKSVIMYMSKEQKLAG